MAYTTSAQPLSSPTRKLAIAALDSMLSWQHWRELRPNRSPEIDAVNREAGVPPGSYWCESSRYSAHNRAARAAKVRNPFLRTASVSMQLRHARRLGSGLRVIPMRAGVVAKPGDTYCIKSGGGTERDIGKLWPGHTGMVVMDLGAYIMDISGNSSKAGSRNGDRVIMRKRHKSSILALIRI